MRLIATRGRRIASDDGLLECKSLLRRASSPQVRGLHLQGSMFACAKAMPMRHVDVPRRDKRAGRLGGLLLCVHVVGTRKRVYRHVLKCALHTPRPRPAYTHPCLRIRTHPRIRTPACVYAPTRVYAPDAAYTYLPVLRTRRCVYAPTRVNLNAPTRVHAHDTPPNHVRRVHQRQRNDLSLSTMNCERHRRRGCE